MAFEETYDTKTKTLRHTKAKAHPHPQQCSIHSEAEGVGDCDADGAVAQPKERYKLNASHCEITSHLTSIQ